MSLGDEKIYIVTMEVDVLVTAENEEDAGTQAISLLNGEAWAVSGKVLEAQEEEIWSSKLGS